MSESFDFSKSNFFDLFQFAVLNPQIAMLSYLKVAEKMAERPDKMKEAQQDLLERMIDIQKDFVKEVCKDIQKADDKEHAETDKSCINLEYNKDKQKYEDKSKSNAENPFEDHPAMKFSRKFHDTVGTWLMDTLNEVDGVDARTMHSAKFFLKQYIDMMSPKNFPLLNPDFLQTTIDTYGENVRDGLKFLMKDLHNGTITTNDREKFKIGENIAATPGKVVYQNDLIELIQYSPTTEKVFMKPILMVPPWINKFYVLDLSPKTSFVKWLVDKGFTVFMISWVNPNKKFKDKGFDNYIVEGLIEAVNKVHDITHVKSMHALGYCVGGTLIASALAYLANPESKHKIKAIIDSVTLLTTLLDFDKAGDMSIFMAGNYLDAIDAQMGEKGYLDGNIMFNTFSALKANDMIWRYFVNSYMLGKKPIAHEILFWNSDPTNLTEAMQKYLSKDLYRDNKLKEGVLKVLGVPLDLKLIKTPIYMISMEKDHLVPWKAAFDGMKLFNSGIRFVVGGSGHVAGAMNHPNKNKYCYWINEKMAKTAEEWFETATKIAGSWWNDWFEWVAPMMGEMIAPREIGKYLRDAPGVYVNNVTEVKEEWKEPDQKNAESNERSSEKSKVEKKTVQEAVMV